MHTTEPGYPLDAIVIGLGRTGIACLRHLQARGQRVAAADTRDQAPMADRARREMPGVEIRTGALDAEWLLRARQVVVSPGVSVHDPAIARAADAGVEIVGDIELFARACDTPVIAITGSNGKSTVTRLVEHMGGRCGVDVVAAGNIGTPVLELLDGDGHDCYAMELSSFQLETTSSLKPVVATVLNVTHDHMDRYRSLDEYRRAKQRIYRGARSVVVNRDDTLTEPDVPAPTRFSFGSDAPAEGRDFGLVDADGETWLARGGERVLAASGLRLRGRHNQLNVLAALALAAAAGWDVHACAAAAAEFEGLPHRMELVRRHRGVTWVNDSKATNEGAAVAALSGTAGPVVLIAGGDGKGADFALLGGAVARHARAVVVLGRDGPRIADAIGGRVPVLPAADLEDAVARASEAARAGDTVLFSPACASFDMFRDYEQRGDAFRTAVEALS